MAKFLKFLWVAKAQILSSLILTAVYMFMDLRRPSAYVYEATFDQALDLSHKGFYLTDISVDWYDFSNRPASDFSEPDDFEYVNLEIQCPLYDEMQPYTQIEILGYKNGAPYHYTEYVSPTLVTEKLPFTTTRGFDYSSELTVSQNKVTCRYEKINSYSVITGIWVDFMIFVIATLVLSILFNRNIEFSIERNRD